MRFAFIADAPDWALHRQGMGLVKYGSVDGHTWALYHTTPRDFRHASLDGVDLVRVGGAPLLDHCLTGRLLPIEMPIVVSLASFRDHEMAAEFLGSYHDRIRGIVTVDRRLIAPAARFGLPTFAFPDRTDPEVFCPMPDLRPSAGPLRVGWAGSVASWGGPGGCKHLDTIEAACGAVEGVTLVRQDRERDGLLDAEGMARWLNGLDLYVSLNDEATPTPVTQLEAASCGIPCITTACGSLWPEILALAPWRVLGGPSETALVQTLRGAVKLGRSALRLDGFDFLNRMKWHLHWDATEHTTEFTRFCAALVK